MEAQTCIITCNISDDFGLLTSIKSVKLPSNNTLTGKMTNVDCDQCADDFENDFDFTLNNNKSPNEMMH